MKIHSDYLTMQTKTAREFVNITPHVEAAVRKSGIQDGITMVAALHANSAILLNLEEPGFLQDVDAWLDKLAPFRDDYKLSRATESNASAYLKNLLCHHQVLLSVNTGKLEIGPWQQILYAEFDGGRPKRVLVKVLGE